MQHGASCVVDNMRELYNKFNDKNFYETLELK
jgi:hypothetical protein